MRLPTHLRSLEALAVLCLLGIHGESVIAEAVSKEPGGSPPVADPAGFTVTPLWTEEQTPLDYLEKVGQHTKARWRQLYRPPPPTPAPNRAKTAITLGSLVAEAFLCLQATDAQQFRNNHQEIMSYSKTLGLGEKLAPRTMAQSKMAEMEQWADLRDDLTEGYFQLKQLLVDQRDEDLAILLDLGVWMRTLEMVSTLVVEDPETAVLSWCVGSPDLLEDLREQFEELSESIRLEEPVAEMDSLLDFLWRYWNQCDVTPPPQEVVLKTQERLTNTLRQLTLKQ